MRRRARRLDTPCPRARSSRRGPHRGCLHPARRSRRPRPSTRRRTARGTRRERPGEDVGPSRDRIAIRVRGLRRRSRRRIARNGAWTHVCRVPARTSVSLNASADAPPARYRSTLLLLARHGARTLTDGVCFAEAATPLGSVAYLVDRTGEFFWAFLVAGGLALTGASSPAGAGDSTSRRWCSRRSGPSRSSRRASAWQSSRPACASTAT